MTSKTTSKNVADCKKTLGRLATCKEIKLFRIPGDCNFDGRKQS